MKIDFTKKQYWDLMRAVYMAYWMTNAICEEGMEEDQGIEDIEKYMYSFAKEFGFEEFVEYSEYLKRHCATLTFDDDPGVREYIDRYDDHIFWEELVERLAERDLLEKFTEEEIDAMLPEEFFDRRMECESVWGEEFEKHGLNRLRALDIRKVKKA